LNRVTSRIPRRARRFIPRGFLRKESGPVLFTKWQNWLVTQCFLLWHKSQINSLLDMSAGSQYQTRRPPSMSRTMPPARVAVPKSSAKLPTLTSGKGASPALEEELMKHPGRHLVPQPKTTLFIKLSQTCPRQLAQSRSRHGMFHPKLISPAPVALLV